MRNVLRGFGIAFLVWGFVLAIQQFQITGFSFLEEISPSTSSFLSLLFIGMGLVLLSLSHSHRFKPAGLATLVGASDMPAAHEEAHNAANYHALRTSYARREQAEHTLRHMESGAIRLHSVYGLPPSEQNSEEWVTFYHAYPAHKGFRLTEDAFVDEKRLKGGFFFADSPHKAQEELPTLHPSEIALLKIKIARKICDELEIEKQTSNFSDYAYKLPKSMAERANDFYRAGYIVVEEHGKKHSGRFRQAA